MKNIYFINFCNLTPHLETSLELARQHLDNGDNVYYYFLGHDTPYRESIFPVFPIPGKLLGPLLPERRGAKLLAHPRFHFITNVSLPVGDYKLPSVSDIEDLKKISYQGWDLGMAIASSLISLTKNSEPEIARYESLIMKMATSVVSVFQFTRNLLRTEDVSMMYIFNGRFCNERAVLRACEIADVPYRIYERGANKDLYYLRPFMPHDKNSIQKEMRQVWNDLEDKERGAEIARQWFRTRRSGQDTDWYSYSKHQQKNLLPDLQGGRKIVTYFHSSDDEYAAIGDQFLWHGWANQYDAVVKMIGLAKEMNNVQLIIRLHPHLAKKSPEENIKWKALKDLSDKVTVIEPSSQVDSYALIDNSEIIISSGSKAGIEAVFSGKPSILFGPSPYDQLDVTYPANTVEQLAALIEAPSLLGKNAENLLMYGFWWATHGDPFKYYKPLSLGEGLFMGVNLQKQPRFFSFLLSLKKRLATK